MPGVRRAALAAIACAVAGALLWIVTFAVPAAQRLDARAQHGFMALEDTRVIDVTERLARIAEPAPFAIAAAALIGIALLRRRRRAAAAAGAVLLGANVTTQILKVLLPRASSVEPPVEWPSGHATAAMTLALCLLLVLPARARPPAAVLGGAASVVVGLTVVALEAHVPSDVAGGMLVAGAWMAGAIAMLRRAPRRSPASAPPDGVRRGRPLRVYAATAAGLAAIGGALVLTSGGDALHQLAAHRTSTIVSAAITALAAVLTGGAALAVAYRSPETTRG